MARRKRLCMISTENEGEQHHNEELGESNSHPTTETNGSHSSEHNLQTDEERSENQNDVEGTRKKIQGPTQKNELWDMKRTKKIVVTFNKYAKPVGDEANELTQFLGSIVRIAGNVGLDCCDWRKVPMSKKEDMYSTVKEKFVFMPTETSAIKKWVFSSMGKKLNTWRNLVKSCNYDPSLTIDEMIARQTDNRVNPEQFKDLVTRWMTPEYQAICEQKRDNRSKMEEPHVTGTKSFARLAHEEAMKNNGVQPTRREIYQKSRTRKNGSIVNDKAENVITSLQAIASDSCNTESLEDDWRHDDFSKVKGPEKRGYVRCIGKMPSVKDNNATSAMDPEKVEQRLTQTQGVVNALVNIIKEYIPNANLSSVLNNMNIEIPENVSMDRNNSPNVNNGSSS